MQRPLPNEHNPSFSHYINLVGEGEYFQLLKQNTHETIRFFNTLPTEKHDYRYAAGKWNLKEMLLHIADTERVFAYRALVAGRGDSSTILYGMDENLYAQHADVSNRTMADLVEEFAAVRTATEKLLVNLKEEQTSFIAQGNPYPVSARALAYVMIGHIIHHIGVVKERYL
jgi:uncharacterized damage-inducible protein DinB